MSNCKFSLLTLPLGILFLAGCTQGDQTSSTSIESLKPQHSKSASTDSSTTSPEESFSPTNKNYDIEIKVSLTGRSISFEPATGDSFNITSDATGTFNAQFTSPTKVAFLIPSSLGPLTLAGDGAFYALSGDPHAPLNLAFTEPNSGHWQLSTNTDGDSVAVLEVASKSSFLVANQAFYDASWTKRGDGISLFLTPTTWARNADQTVFEYAWQELAQYDEGAGRETTTETMVKQLRCHLVGAKDKATWNLEPWRENLSLLEFYQARCNP